MTCRELADLLHDLVAEELEAEHRGRAELHLGQCPSCGALIHSYRVVVEVARRLPPPAPPPGLMARLAQLPSARVNAVNLEPGPRGA
jgi:anti-sigma factor RsiW